MKLEIITNLRKERGVHYWIVSDEFKKMKVSVIIPAYNEEKYIGKCLDSLLKQTYEDLEIIVINDGSKDKTLKIIRNYEKKI